MGATFKILLVIVLLTGQTYAEENVDPRQHRAFWLWSGVKASNALQNAQTVYLHQGEVLERSGEAVLCGSGYPLVV